LIGIFTPFTFNAFVDMFKFKYSIFLFFFSFFYLCSFVSSFLPFLGLLGKKLAFCLDLLIVIFDYVYTRHICHPSYSGDGGGRRIVACPGQKHETLSEKQTKVKRDEGTA
jgi:hypothetical protein